MHRHRLKEQEVLAVERDLSKLAEKDNMKLAERVAKARGDLEIARELQRCMVTDRAQIEVARAQQRERLQEHPEVVRLRGLLASKRELQAQLQRENEELMKD